MSEKMKDGGPAFPTTIANTSGMAIETPFGVTVEGNSTTYFHGMTMRDYFAAKAMQGMMAVPDGRRYGDRADKSLSIEEWQEWCVTGMVEHAYRMADAMLAQREK